MKGLTQLMTAAVVAATLGLAACESAPLSKVPARAEPVASSNGDTAYRTADAGTIYIYDKTWDKLVYTGAVQPDQVVRVEASHDRVTIDGRPVVEQISLGEGDHFDIYLDTHNPQTTRTVERRTVIEREIHE